MQFRKVNYEYKVVYALFALFSQSKNNILTNEKPTHLKCVTSMNTSIC